MMPPSRRLTTTRLACCLFLLAIAHDAPGDPQQSVTHASPGKSAQAVVPLPHPTAEINADELSNITIPLTRDTPWGSADGSATLKLRETSRRYPLPDVHIFSGTIFEKDTKKIVLNADFKVAPLPSPFALPPSGEQSIPLHFAHMSKAGEFATQFVVSSRGLAADKVIPIRVTVTDAIGFPITVIFMGVIGGATVNFVAEKRRRRLINAYHIVQLTDILNQLKTHVTDPLKRQTLQAQTDAINSAKLNNEEGAFTDAEAQLKEIEKQLQDFRAAEAKQKEELIAALLTLTRQADSYLGWPGISDAEAAQLQEVKTGVQALTGELDREQTDQVALELAPLQSQIAALRKEHLVGEREALRAEFLGLSPFNSTERESAKSIDKLFTTAITQIAVNKLDDAAASLEQIRIQITDIRKERKQGLRFTSGANSVLLPEPHPGSPTVPTITISNMPLKPVSGADLTFKIQNAETILQPGDSYAWSFGDASGQNPTQAEPTHRFETSGLYHVTVEVRRGNPPVTALKLTTDFIIAPGEVEMKEFNILKSLRAGDFIVLGASVVIATLTGLGSLYLDHVFGTPKDYISAFLWGFGTDFSVRGFVNVMKKVSTGG